MANTEFENDAEAVKYYRKLAEQGGCRRPIQPRQLLLRGPGAWAKIMRKRRNGGAKQQGKDRNQPKKALAKMNKEKDIQTVQLKG